ncbi:macro domain-containing protein [Fulvitalea axinellae]|uniref:Macro domain-containing protein n=1 Tax=Fulvitalea axinellae TaxID=1182444 RepID=A0AAU9CDF4_9BACT|nr:macro domain-containing protein [Fulvitalea axinellae]
MKKLLADKISLLKGDITKVKCDAIVNAANSSLLGGGGVDGAIHRQAGPELLEDCRRVRNAQGGCPTGKAVITVAGKLPAKYVIHTVGPVWRGGASGEESLLRDCYLNSLSLASENGLETVAFPNISTGIYGYPKDKACAVAVSAVNEFLASDTIVKEVVFVCFDDENFRLYQDFIGN